jgi:phospholipid:diacylglycerol acyltransferase
LGFILVQPTDISELHASLALLLSEYDIQLPQIPELDLTGWESEWKRLRSNIPEIWKLNQDGREFMVGEEMKARGLTAKFPVVLVPGVISTVRCSSLILHEYSC